MSRRQVHRAGRQTIPYGPDVDRTVIHWSYESRKYEPTTESADSDIKNRVFVYKAWEADADNFSVIDDGADEPLPLKSTNEIVEEVETTDGGLTASDIRGAVGGEAIPGIASAAAGPKEEPAASSEPSEPSAVASNEPSAEMSVEPAVSTEPSIEPEASVEPEQSVEPAVSTEASVEPASVEPTSVEPESVKVEVEDVEMQDA